jgi:hypothetical protein
MMVAAARDFAGNTPALRRPEMTRTILALGLGAIIAAVGCAPERPDATPGTDVNSDRLAVLASDGTGGWKIDILDRTGEVSNSLAVGNIEPSGFAYHPDGFFLVHDWQNIYALDMQEQWERFNNQNIDSGIFRINVTDDDVTVAAEYDVTEIDRGGDIIADTNVPSTYCWMDASDGDDGDAALLDIFGPNIATWDADSGSFDVIATNVGDNVNILGQDGGGSYWAASTYGDRVQHVDQEGNVESIYLNDLNAWGVKSLEEAGRDSVYALYEGNVGNGIAVISANGDVEEFTAADGEIWIDMVAF